MERFGPHGWMMVGWLGVVVVVGVGGFAPFFSLSFLMVELETRDGSGDFC